MTTIELVQAIHRNFAGNRKYPARDSDKWLLYLDTANPIIRDWATDSDNRWSSCLNPDVTIGTISTGQQSYPLPDNVSNLSDYIFLTFTDGRVLRINVIKPKDRFKKSGVYVWGNDPKQITFTDVIRSDLVGATIHGGCYEIPDPLRLPSGTVPVDRPLWVAYRTAAQLSLQDPAKEDKYGDLNDLANEQWTKMVAANDSLPAEQEDVIDVAGIPDVGLC